MCRVDCILGWWGRSSKLQTARFSSPVELQTPFFKRRSSMSSIFLWGALGVKNAKENTNKLKTCFLLDFLQGPLKALQRPFITLKAVYTGVGVCARVCVCVRASKKQPEKMIRGQLHVALCTNGTLDLRGLGGPTDNWQLAGLPADRNWAPPSLQLGGLYVSSFQKILGWSVLGSVFKVSPNVLTNTFKALYRLSKGTEHCFFGKHR